QVDVHGVDAQVARAHPANDGVEVGAVAIKIGARLVGQAADLQYVALEQAAGVRVGDHDGRHVRTQLGGQVSHVDATVVGLGDLDHRIADEGGGGRVGAVGRGRDQDLAALLMLALGFVGG